eukprot:scaffold19963_cov102-Phaeocystis_antarctica.AAC.3
MEASAARDERAGRWQRRRRLRLHGCSLATRRGARQRRSQRIPQRASRATAEAPPLETAQKPAQPATSEPGRQPRRRRLRLHGCSLAPRRGARQRRSQRSPRRASKATAAAPPPEAARVQPRTTPWCGPA